MTDTATPNQRLAQLCQATGITCVLISAGHFLFGTAATTPGVSDANASVDSQERFFAAVFAWYGWKWLRAGSRSPVPAAEVRALSGIMALGGVGRVISIVHRGRPHWFMVFLAVVEFVLPAGVFALLRRANASG